MHYKSFLPGLFVLSFFTSSALTQDLTLNEVARFPRAPYNSIVHYDGDEWIYIFHRVFEDPRVSAELWRFSVTNSSLENLSKTNYEYRPALFFGGGLESSIYGFGVYEQFDLVPLAIGLPDGLFSLVPNTTFPLSSEYAVGFPHNNEIFVVCGEYCNSTYKFNPNTNEYNLLREIPLRFQKKKPTATVVNDKAFIFGYPTSTAFDQNQTFSVLDLKTMEFSDGPENFLRSGGAPSAIYDGKFIYYISTHSLSEPKNGVYRIDPQTYEREFIQVENFPVFGNLYFSEAPRSVFVPKLNGIFLIGGVVANTFGNGEWLETISFVDLSPISPTTPPPPITTTTLSPDFFSCVNHTEGFYPHPLDCARFIGCHDGVAEFYECPQPLLFDPVLGTCSIPQLVDCEISCADKPDGLYPHPHECALFILCSSENLDVYKCPDPLLFDPSQNICNFPENVTCQL